MQQPTLMLSGSDGAPVDLFAQLAKVREQLSGGEAPPVVAVRSPAVDPRKKPTPATEDEPSSKRQRSDQEPSAEAAAVSEEGDTASSTGAPDEAAVEATDDAGAGDLFAQLAKLQQAQAAAGTTATNEEGTAAEGPDDAAAGGAPADPGASDPVGGPSVDQWNGANGGIDMGFEVLP
jgi:hypothetical protein